MHYQTFSVGDDVKFNRNYPDPEVNGVLGKVIEVRSDGEFPILVHFFLNGDVPLEFWCAPDEIDYLQKEIAYDPAQQGDREDDI